MQSVDMIRACCNVTSCVQALEQGVEKLLEEIHTLGVKGLPMALRDAAIQKTIQAIHNACSLCAWPESQVLPMHLSNLCMGHGKPAGLLAFYKTNAFQCILWLLVQMLAKVAP